jgi:hypothetical protein
VPEPDSLVRLTLFVVATVVPYILASRTAPAGGSERVHRRFETVVLGTGGLSFVLHAVAFTVGLSLGAVVAGMAGLVLAAGVVSVRLRRAQPPAPGPEARDWLAIGSTLVATVIGVSWLVSATMALDVAGTDAAHYHVPHAVNYALGATPWDPLPTRHAYPMGTSLLFAWFILPFGDAFIVDAAMIVHAAVLVVSLAVLLRSLTGLDGWAWTPAGFLALLSLPLFAAAGLPSADLPYAAGFIACAAQAWRMVTDRRGTPRDWLVLGAALGLLLAPKVTGALSAAAIAVPAVVATGVGIVRTSEARRRWRMRPVWAAVAALVIGSLPGLLWFARNQWVYGQPVDTFPDRFHLSIYADLHSTYQNDWFYLARRTARRMHQWMGPWFLASGWAILALAVESLSRYVAKKGERLDAHRLWFVAVASAVGVLHAAALIQAPWTSLEWTEGSSLRYILPVWTLWALVAFAALFSRWLPWHRVAAGRAVAWALLVTAAVAPIVTRGYDPWWAGVKTMPFTVAPIAAAFLAAGPFLFGPRRGWAREALAAGVMVVLASGLAFWLAARHAPLAADAAGADQQDVRAWIADRSGPVEAHRRLYLEARADEQQRGRSCEARRFFWAAGRFDLPLDVQPARYSSLVFDGRDPARSLEMLRHPQPGVCDYVVIGRDEMSRPLARTLGPWLAEISADERFRIFRADVPAYHRP